MPFEEGPYIQMAAFCDYVLEDKTGALSVIRIIDRFVHQLVGPDAPPEMPVVPYNFTLVIMLKSGRAKGRHEVTIIPEEPSGQKLTPVTQSVLFEGGERGANIILRGTFSFKMEGIYWFDILLGDTLLTRVPLRVIYQRIVTGTGPQG